MKNLKRRLAIRGQSCRVTLRSCWLGVIFLAIVWALNHLVGPFREYPWTTTGHDFSISGGHLNWLALVISVFSTVLWRWKTLLRRGSYWPVRRVSARERNTEELRETVAWALSWHRGVGSQVFEAGFHSIVEFESEICLRCFAVDKSENVETVEIAATSVEFVRCKSPERQAMSRLPSKSNYYIVPESTQHPIVDSILVAGGVVSCRVFSLQS